MLVLVFTLFTAELVFGSGIAFPKRHFVFFVHGVGGNIESFGKMPEYLPAHLNDYQHEFKYSGHIYVYPTADDDQNTNKFAQGLSQFISKTIAENTQKGEDYRISLITHSQGGIVTMIWYYRTLVKDPNFQDNNIGKLHTVITLGTPFWGSKLAAIATDKEWLWWFDNKYPGKLGMLSNVGERQLKDMAFTSEVLQNFRTNLSAIAPYLQQTKLSNIRFLNVAGNANLKTLTEDKLKEKSSWFSKLLPFVFGKVEYESDGAVLIPSATLNTLYHKNIVDDYEDGKSQPLKLENLQFADRLIIKTVHASTKPDELSDICYLQDRCSDLSKCKHPAYIHVLNYMLGGDVPEFADNVKYYNFGGFTVDVHVRLPKGYEHIKDKVSVTFDLNAVRSKKTDKYTEHIQIANPLEIASKLKTTSTGFKDVVSFWYTGHIYRMGDEATKINRERPLPKSEKIVEATIRAPGMKTRKVKVKVKPTLSSYVEVNLVKGEEEPGFAQSILRVK